MDSGPLLAADNKVYWWSISGPLSVANDKFSIGPPVAHPHEPPTSSPLLPSTFYDGSLVA